MESYSIPIPKVKELIMYLPFGSSYRCAILILCVTGARLSELNAMGLKSLAYPYLVWKVGKNQRGYRKEILPEWAWNEVRAYLGAYPASPEHLFSFTGETLTSHFNRYIRPNLSSEWQEKRWSSGLIKQEYIYQLKSLRHNYATAIFFAELNKWGSADLAISKTSCRMRHSSTRLTAERYLNDADTLGIRPGMSFNLADELRNCNQSKLVEWL